MYSQELTEVGAKKKRSQLQLLKSTRYSPTLYESIKIFDDKWTDLAAAVYDLVDYSLTVREDLDIIFLCHTQVERDDSGYSYTRIKTSGKKIDKIVLESKFPVVLLAKQSDGKHIFETHANNSTAKTPLGAFEESEIPNDMQYVLDVLHGKNVETEGEAKTA